MRALKALYLIIGIALIFVVGFQAKPDSKAPSDADQLVIVRYSALVNDAMHRQLEAQAAYDKATADIQKFKDAREKAVATAQAKLEKPKAGFHWEPVEDGSLGCIFQEVADKKIAEAVAGTTTPQK